MEILQAIGLGVIVVAGLVVLLAMVIHRLGRPNQ